MRKGLFLVPIVAASALVLGFLAYSPSASAALDGENGPIIYIENESQNNNKLAQEVILVPDNQVVATDQQGNNEQIVEQTSDPITSAAISAPKDNATFDVAIATETMVGCQENEKTCALVEKVNVDYAGAPTSDPTDLATLDSLVNTSANVSSKTWVSNLSYSPDGDTVLATQYSVNSNENMRSAVVAIDNNSGATTTVVTPRRDPCLNAGYADNGTIYYSRINSPLNDIYGCAGLNTIESEINYQSDIWFIRSGEVLPTRLTYTPKISEFFIDVSPDNQYVLVADTNTYYDNEEDVTYECNYGLNVVFYTNNFFPFGCNYYYVSTFDGSYELITQMPEYFIPKYFSPDNSSLIGTVYPRVLLPGLESFNLMGVSALAEVDTEIPYTASLNRTTFELTAISNRLGVQQWTPIAQVQPVVPVVPVSVVTTTSKATLPNTGISTNLIATVAMMLVGIGLIGAAASIVKIKK